MEDAGLVVRVMRMVGVKDDVPALVADEIFVEGGKKKDAPAAETARPGVPMGKEVAPFPALDFQFVAERRDALPAFPDVDAAPPDEVLQRGRTMAAEVFPRQEGERLLAGKVEGMRNLLNVYLI